MHLQQRLGVSYLFIAHDLAAVAHMSRAIAVMYLGKIVELGDADAVALSPKHPYTKILLSALPENATGDRLPTMKGFVLDETTVPGAA